MILFIVAFISGVLTVLAPCILPLLPVIVGGSITGGVNRKRAYVVSASLKGFQSVEKEASVSGEERVEVTLVLPAESK